MGSLKGPAEKILSGIPVTNENYDVAWNLLKDRFENETLTLKNHVKALFELPCISESYSLRNLKDDFLFRFRAIEALGEPVNTWDTLLIHLLTSKLDSRTDERWEEALITRKIRKPTLNILLEFLTDRCNLAESREKTATKNKPSTNQPNKFGKSFQSNKINKFNKPLKTENKIQTFAVTEARCPCCNEKHFIYRCEKFKNLTVAARWDEVNRLNLCCNCLRNNHRTPDCTSQGCKVCGNTHNTMLHTDASTKTECNGIVAVACSSENSNRITQILLSTALIWVKGSNNKFYRCKALLDSGAQSNFMSKELFEKLRLTGEKIKLPVLGVGGISANINNRVHTTITSLNKTFSTNLSFLVLDKITSKLPNLSFSKNVINLPNEVDLADPEFNLATNIDILIGAELFYSLLETEQIRLGDDLPILQRSRLGWLVSGPLNFPASDISCYMAVNDSLEELLERFWKIEELPREKTFSTEEQACETHFSTTTKRNNEGRFVVSLPFKESVGNFGNSVHNAIKRLQSVERRFRKNADFKQKYVDFMAEYEALGHMTKICGMNNVANSSYYLPHHGVLNESSTTTKLRVVFDGSCRSTNGISLNDKLLVGPTLQDDLWSILIRFRLHNYVMTGDIEKMYRQVLISNEERDLQRIVWRKNENEPIQHYTLNTVTYGTASASFLAVRSLQQAGIDHEIEFPLASKVILQDFYVDDLITGAFSISEAQSLRREIILILNKYGFNLRKWVVNDSRILDFTSEHDKCEYHITDNEIKKALGVYWQSKNDTFQYVINITDFQPTLITKRNLLSAISKIFDPLGLVAPITIKCKLLLQKLWQMKVDWDDELPQELISYWEEFTNQLVSLNNIRISRHVLMKIPKDIELHVFSDASLKAYGAAVYIKSQFNGQTMVSLMCSKTRVAPIKSVTLPRLELCGAVLGVQLHSKIVSSLTLEVSKSYFWTDSTIVLSWLNLPANSLKIFVSNRVSIIQQNTNFSQWRYVPSIDNPADVLSRGVCPSELRDHRLWWSGPDWLWKNCDNWPKLENVCTEIPERRNQKIILLSTCGENELFKRYSSFYQLQRIVAHCLRFISNCRRRNTDRNYKEILPIEINQATSCLLKLAQADSFSAELLSLKNNKPISKRSKLLSLSPFIDPEGLLRVGGRLMKVSLPYNQKHQVILDPNHSLTKSIILHEHRRQLHSGIQTLLNSLRQTYWILRGRLTIRSVLRKCLTCFRVNPSRIVQKMASLPEMRITQNRPFYASGLDFAGPFYIKDGKLRNRKIIKAYLCIFICFCTKAVHLEAVSDLTSKALLNAIKRFISRRGICKLLYSDNGSNLIGANNELKSIFESIKNNVSEALVENYLNENKIEWRFIPPRSPHHGGLWEAAVKRAKYHILRVIGKNNLTFEELSTVFCQIEAVINSRPITPISDDPNDLQALTPGHFLIGDNLTSIPQSDLIHLPNNRLTQYHQIQAICQQFWKRWSSEYLVTLQQRSRWHDPTSSIPIGSLVLLVDENNPPLLWKMGRITSIHKSSDGLPRICTVKTSAGTFERAVQKLCLVPVDIPTH